MPTWQERKLMRICEECMEIQSCLMDLDKRRSSLARVLPIMEASASELKAEIRRLSLVVLEDEAPVTPQAA